MKRELMATLVLPAGTHGARVIAEGVESEGEARALVEAGAAYAQGFLFGSPAAAARPGRGADGGNGAVQRN